MDWSIIISDVLKAVCAIGGSLIVIIIGIVAKKICAKLKETRLYDFIKEAVKAAEQLFPNTSGIQTGTEKYKYVVQRVLSEFSDLTDSAYLQALIEGAVYSLNNKL